MRFGALVLVIVTLLCVLSVAVVLAQTSASPSAGDTGSISRDSRGTSTYGARDVFGGPPTPRIYGFGQMTIFLAGALFVILAVILGVYTFMSARR